MSAHPDRTLCISCDRAYAIPGRGCSWILCGKPVEGWTAEDSYIWTKQYCTHSYRVKACPLYIPDPPRKTAEEPPKRRYAGRDTKRYNYRGRWMTIRELAFESDMNDETIKKRLDRGLTVEEAVEMPLRYRNTEG